MRYSSFEYPYNIYQYTEYYQIKKNSKQILKTEVVCVLYSYYVASESQHLMRNQQKDFAG